MDNMQQEHARRVRGMFSRIAGVYDFLNRIFSLGLDAHWRARLVAAAAPFPPGGTGCILDLAAGTLEVTLALAGRYPQASVLAMDLCPPMLAAGLPKLERLKKRRAGGKNREKPCGAILPVAGDGRFLPLPDASIDAVTLAFGLRHMRPRGQAYAEALRVLVPGGKLCVLEFGSTKDRIFFGLYNVYLHYLLPLAGRLVSGDKDAYRCLADTVAAFPSAVEMEEEMRRAGFAGVRHTRHTAGIVCIHVGVKPAASRDGQTA